MDKKFLAFLHDQHRCAIHGAWACSDFQVHHVRSFGSQKNDRRAFGLCAALHLHDGGPYSIERLGKAKFCALWEIDLEVEIERDNAAYAALSCFGAKSAAITRARSAPSVIPC